MVAGRAAKSSALGMRGLSAGLFRRDPRVGLEDQGLRLSPRRPNVFVTTTGSAKGPRSADSICGLLRRQWFESFPDVIFAHLFTGCWPPVCATDGCRGRDVFATVEGALTGGRSILPTRHRRTTRRTQLLPQHPRRPLAPTDTHRPPPSSRRCEFQLNPPLGPADGMPVDCAITLDNLRTVPQALLVESIMHRDEAKMSQVCRALLRATGCSLARGTSRMQTCFHSLACIWALAARHLPCADPSERARDAPGRRCLCRA